MFKKNKIYVAGHNGMVGSAIVKNLVRKGYENLLLKDRKELDLINQKNVELFFKKNKPDVVFIAAALVGGIKANNIFRGQFLYENLMIQSNIIHSSYKYNVKKLIFLGSACIYPKESEQPIKEESLLTDILEPTNEPYSIAKIAGIKMCENYFLQYKKNFISIMPNNLYGENDNFDLDSSHVLPALMNKLHTAKENKLKKIEVWGTGKPMREFLHVDDLADCCVFILENLDANELYSQNISHINVGSGEELSIKDLAFLMRDIVGYEGDIIFNKSMPDGMKRKLLDTTKINNKGWYSKISLKDGIKNLYNWYKKKI